MSVATEAEIQQAIVEGLEAHRFIVLTTSRPRFKCPGCGTVRHGGDAVSKGLPDVMFTHEAWPLGVWAGIEVKKNAGAQVREEQGALQARGRILVTWEPEEAWDWAEALHAFLLDAWAEETNLPPGVLSPVQRFTLRWSKLHE